MIFSEFRTTRAISKGTGLLQKRILDGKYGLSCSDQHGQPRYSDQKGHLFSIFFLLDAFGSKLPELIRTVFLTRILSEEQNGMWGYSPRAYYVNDSNNPFFVDADDTAFALRSLRKMGVYRSARLLDPYLTEVGLNGGNLKLYRTFINNERPSVVTNPSPENNLMVHPEVNANIFHFLVDTDREDLISDSFIGQVQQKDGMWPSYFYPIPYYSTYIFISLIKRAKLCADPLEMAKQAILADQRPEGGFGRQHDPLSTAFAVRCLQLMGFNGKELTSGIGHLLKAQDPDGGWSTRSPIWQFHHEDGSVWTARDSYRIFTTSICLAALNDFNEQHQ